jgi:hypothetical protein
MPALIAGILEGLAIIGRALVPWFLRAGKLLGVNALLAAMWAWVEMFMSAKVVSAVVTAGIVTAGLGVWAVFLGLFWTWAFGNGLREIFNSNPLTGLPAGVLYLASYVFPFKFALGITFAYIQWKFTYIQAMIVMNRLIKALPGF